MMRHIPDDAAHWDSGDWIAWHRALTSLDDSSFGEEPASEEPMARLTALHVSLTQAAKGYFELTGHHLPVYRELAHAYAAIHCDLPYEAPDRDCGATGVEVLHIEPHASHDGVFVDLTKPFVTLIVVRIAENFSCEARMIQRASLPEGQDGPCSVTWDALPHKL